MEFEIKKENFTSDSFNPQNFLNSILKISSDAESEIINFKLKILQREFSNELELNTNNLLKFSKILETDINQTNASNNISFQNFSQINNNKIDNKHLQEIEKAFKLKNKNKNLTKALSVLEKI